MEQQNIAASQHKDEISLKELLDKLQGFIQYLKTKWLSLVLAGLLGGILGIGYYYLQTPKYTAECTFILEEKSSGGGGLAGIASQFGFDIGSAGGGSSLFAGDNLLEIIPSKKIVKKVLLTKIDSTNDQTLADLYLDFTKLKKAWFRNPKLAEINFVRLSDNNLSLLQDSILNVIYNEITKSYLVVEWKRKKASLISVSVTSKNEKFSKYLSERLVNESKNLYTDLKTFSSQANVNRLQMKADSLLFLLNDKSYEAAEFQILNLNSAIKQPLVQTEISLRDKAIISAIYSEVVKNLETNKILLTQQTPIIQVIDSPNFPLVLIQKGFFLCISIGVIILEVVFFLIFLIKFLNRKETI